MVFVEMVEGGLTRLVATWHSQAVDKVGPVRSIRPMDADIVAPYGGVFCFSGGLSQFVAMMRETGLYMADETSERDAAEDSFSRTKEKSAPHNLVVNMALLQSQHADRGGAGAMFTYSEDIPESQRYVPDPKTVKEIQELRIYLATLQTGTPTPDVTIKYPMATSYWAGDGAGNLLRTQDKAPHLDAVTNEQVRAKNVVVMQVEIDNTYGQIPKTVMVSSGAAWVFQDGNAMWLVGDFTVTGSLDTSTLVLVAIVAFGLSMDYELFLLSRIKEEHDNGADTTTSVSSGLQKSGRIITAAAVLIAIVFACFMTSGVTSIKMLGLGVSFAILLDATVVRGLLVPALMRVAGDWNWWAPKPMRKLHARFGISE
jgi:hypothetical protein